MVAAATQSAPIPPTTIAPAEPARTRRTRSHLQDARSGRIRRAPNGSYGATSAEVPASGVTERVAADPCFGD